MSYLGSFKKNFHAATKKLAAFFQKYKTYISILFAIFVLYLVATTIKDTDWPQVWQSVQASSTKHIVLAALTALVSYAAYAAYDLFSSHVLKIKLAKLSAWFIAWISYSANLNLGAIVGSLALRYKLYSKLGLRAGDTSKIIGLSVTTNWVCYALLIGVVGLLNVEAVSKLAGVSEIAITIILLVALTVIITLLFLPSNVLSKKLGLASKLEDFGISKIKSLYPGLAIGVVHWSFMALTMYFAFEQEVDFLTIFTCVLLSCIAGAISHVPGGLGVIEAVFVTLLQSQIDKHEIIASIFVYRAAFYIFPALFTFIFYLSSQFLMRRSQTQSTA